MHYLPEKENKTLNTNYRILRTIGRYFFPSTHWLRPIVHKDEVKKNLVYTNYFILL